MNKDKEPPGTGSTVQHTRRGSIVQLTLNRPDKLNALNTQLQGELVRALDAVSGDDTVHVLILTGAGRGFCAGLDLADFRNSLSHFQEQPGASLFQRLEAVPQPVIAAINGPAVTGGLELALACDLLIAGRNAQFADTHAQFGVMPGAGLSQKLARIVGLPRAMAVSLAGEFVDAEEAWRIGLVSRVAEPETLLDEAWALAEGMAQAEPAVLRELKRVMKEGAALPLGEALRLEREAHERWARGADLAAVLERRAGLLRRNRAAQAAGGSGRGGRPPAARGR